MIAMPLTDLKALNSDWLRAALREQVPTGEIETLEILAASSTHARNARFKLSWSPDAPADAPARLFLKLCQGPTPFGDSEVRSYTAIAAAMPASPFPRCWQAAYDAATGSYHLLLTDLSDTHAEGWEREPALDWAAAAVEALADLHAGWWDASELVAVAGPLPDAAALAASLEPARQGLGAMLRAAELDPLDQELLQALFDALLPAMKLRAATGEHFSCVHGDPNPGNLLLPKAPGGRAWLIDRQLFGWNLGHWLGASDLALMLVPWWEPAARRTFESELLQRYHARLCASGVRDYAFTQLEADYRLGVVQCLALPAARCRDDASRRDFRWVWWPQLKRILAACRDHECLERLG